MRKSIFDSVSLATLTLKNRIIRSATWEGMCDHHGRPKSELAKLYKNLALGQVGLIISGYAFVSLEGKQQIGQAGIHTDDFEEDYKNLTNIVHDNKGTIVLQLVHAGGLAISKNSGYPTFAPSPYQAVSYTEAPQELATEKIKRIISDFAAASQRAKNWGFDGIELHCAHGYLINQFLSPLTNKRTDQYGGDISKRTRFLQEILDNVRNRVGDDFPVLIKINATDHLEGGLEIHDTIKAISLIEKKIDAIEVSSGCTASGQLNPARSKIDTFEKEAYNMDYAETIKKSTSLPIISVGGFRSIESIKNAIENHDIDFVALSRPLIREPQLISRWQSGDTHKATCISCNRCFIVGVKRGIFCPQERKNQKKQY